MRLTISKSKNAEQLYITKSFRVNKYKTSSKIIKKLGSMESLLPQFGNDRDKVITWAKKQAELMTLDEKDSIMKIAIEFYENKIHQKDEQHNFNVGYFFLKNIYHKLSLNKICKNISEQRRISYDFSNILENLIYARIIAPSSKLSSFEYFKNFIECPNFNLHQIYRALDILAENSDIIQAQLYKNSLNVINRNKAILYYDCTNYFFELEEAKGCKQYGKSKENRPNPIVQMGLFLDGDGLPLAFSIFPGNESEQPSLTSLEKQIIKDFNLSKFVVCTDAGLASTANRRFNNINGRSFIVTQSLKKLKKHLQEWALNPNGWRISKSKKIYDLTKIDENKYQETIFYKERWINENGLEQRFVVTFSLKYRNYMRNIRDRQIDRAEKIINKGSSKKIKNSNSPERFIEEIRVTSNGEIAEKKYLTLNESRITEEKSFDGFYGICTTLEDDVNEILKVNKQCWQIESAFRIMKNEFKARPVFLQRDNRIKAHFLTCFLSLLIFKILDKKLENEYTSEEIIQTLRDMNVHKINGYGYLSSYTRSSLTDSLHGYFGFRTDTEFISNKSMKKILKKITLS